MVLLSRLPLNIMKTGTLVRTLALLLMFLAALPMARAEGPGPEGGGYEAWCSQNPEACEKAKAKRAEFEAMCKSDPVKCEQVKQQYREKLKEKCDADPQKCYQAWCAVNPEKCQAIQDKREAFKETCESDPVKCEQMKQEYREKLKEKCKANPERCEEIKQRIRERRQQQKAPAATP
jgi:hypothetical protein